MKKNYLTKTPTKKATKKTAKKPTKKRAKKTLSREARIDRILEKVKEITDYAEEHTYTQPAQFEELEWMLYQYIKN